MPYCVACNIKLSPANELPWRYTSRSPLIFFTCIEPDCVAVVYEYTFPSCKQKMV